MARRKQQPATQPLARIAQPEQAERLLQAGLSSAFAIAKISVEQLQALDPSLGNDQAQTLHQRASALAVLAARHYREQRLTAAQPAEQPWRTGVRALVDGPTFESQFSPSWSDNCTPGSIEATTSPAAYLTSLWTFATQTLEPKADPAKAIPLADRRPDLAGLVLDNQSLSEVVPTISLVNEILESAARKDLDDHNERQRSVDDALLEARYPFILPFERYMSQINRVLGRKDQGLGDLVRQLDPAFPYFSQGRLHSPRSDDALQMDLGVGPEQRALLLEAAYFPRGSRRLSARSVQTRVNPRSLLRESAQVAQSTFFQRHYGVQGKAELLDLTTFCQRTGLDRAGVESLLSIETCAPMASPNSRGLAAASPARFGAVYINAGQEPALGISSSDGKHQLTNATDDHFDRIQRMVRLSRWLEVPFGELDQIIEAALLAEHGEAGRGEAIGENTLRALGLFRRLRRDYKVRAEDFAALLNGVALYGRGIDRPQFDRVFNDPALFSEPLVLDDSPFSIVPANEAEYRRILHLCGALGIGYETYLYVARYIVQSEADPEQVALGEGEMLRWSHGVISTFYRLTRLAAWIGLTPVEAIALLQLIGQRGHQYVSRMVKPGLAVYQHSTLADTLSVVQALTDAVRWCRENDVSVSWLYQRLMPLAPLAMAGERERDLLGQIHVRMLPAIITQSSFIEAGVPMVAGADIPTPIDWFERLQVFISARGLVHDLVEYEDSDDFEAALNARIEVIIDDLELSGAEDVLIKVSRLVMDARAGQQSVAWESLANTFGVSADLSRELLAWAGGTCYQLLDEVLRIHDTLRSSSLPETDIEVMGEVLALLVRLDDRAAIAKAFTLSPLAVRSYLRHRQWFGIEPLAQGDMPEVAEVDFRQLHTLAQYRHLLEFARQPEQTVLDYLALVEELPPDLSEADLQMIREDAASKVAAFTGFGIRDTLETAREVTANGVIATVMQLDHLVRIRQACERLQLSTPAVVALSRLLGNSPRSEYREAAEGALSSLTANRDGLAVVNEGELGQSETSWIVVDHERLVAQSGEVSRCLLTVKDLFGQPAAGITVTWTTDLGQLGAPSSGSTDINGRVEIELNAAEQMGTAQVVARFGLDRQVRAPLILIDCDDDSLDFRDPVCSPREALAGNLDEVEYSVQLLDRYGNPGRDRVLLWSTDLGIFNRPQTRTDADGFARANLRSLSSGQAQVVVRFEHNGNEEQFDMVEFLEQPRFQYVRFSGPAATTQPVTVTCRVVNLDDSPVAGATVSWSANLGGFVGAAQSVTDANGIATIQYLSNDAGVVRVAVNAVVDAKTLIELQSDLTTVYLLPEITGFEPAHQYFILRQARPAEFRVTLSPAISGYPVEWWLDDELLATIYTDRDGTAMYKRHFVDAEVGEQTVTARTVKAGDKVEFKVDVTEAHTLIEITLADDQTGLLPLPGQDASYVLDRRAQGRFVIRALRDGGAGDDNAWVTFARMDGADPDNLNIRFIPALGEKLFCDEAGEAILEIDCSNAAFQANSDLFNNECVLLATSNLGVTSQLTLSLRDLIDLSQCEMKFVQKSGSDVGGISGYLRRADGLALQLRDGHATVRASSDGTDSNGVDAQLMLDSQQQGCIVFRSLGMVDAHKHHCSFFLREGLEKRLYFVATNVREFDESEILNDLSMSFDIGTSERVIVKDEGLYLDAHQKGVLTASIHNAGAPVSGVAWFLPQYVVPEGRFTVPDLLSDSQGLIELHFDVSYMMLSDFNNDFEFAAGIGAFEGAFIMAIREFCRVSGAGSFTRVDSTRMKLSYYLDFYRLEGWFRGGSSNFSGYARLNSLKYDFRIPISSNMVINNEVFVHPTEVTPALHVALTSSRYLLPGNPSVPLNPPSKEAP